MTAISDSGPDNLHATASNEGVTAIDDERPPEIREADGQLDELERRVLDGDDSVTVEEVQRVQAEGWLARRRAQARERKAERDAEKERRRKVDELKQRLREQLPATEHAVNAAYHDALEALDRFALIASGYNGLVSKAEREAESLMTEPRGSGFPVAVDGLDFTRRGVGVGDQSLTGYFPTAKLVAFIAYQVSRDHDLTNHAGRSMAEGLERLFGSFSFRGFQVPPKPASDDGDQESNR